MRIPKLKFQDILRRIHEIQWEKLKISLMYLLDLSTRQRDFTNSILIKFKFCMHEDGADHRLRQFCEEICLLTELQTCFKISLLQTNVHSCLMEVLINTTADIGVTRTLIFSEKVIRSLRINVWVGILVEPLFLNINLTGAVYLNMLEEVINPF